MSLVFQELHRAAKPELLNEEWMILENSGPGVLSSGGWSIEVGKKGARPSSIGTLQPGFLLQAGEKIRLVTGTASKKAQGTPPPEDGIKSYHLFLREAVLKSPGVVLYVKLKQLELASATFDPEAKSGIAAPTPAK